MREWAFGFDLSSAETDFLCLEKEQEEEEKPKLPRRANTHPEYVAPTLGQWLLKLEDLSAAPDKLDHAYREARDFAFHFRVSYDIFIFTVGAAKPVFLSMCPRRWLCLGSRTKAFTLQDRHRRFVGGSVSHSSFRGASLPVGDTAEVESPYASSTELDSTKLHTSIIYTVYAGGFSTLYVTCRYTRTVLCVHATVAQQPVLVDCCCSHLNYGVSTTVSSYIVHRSRKRSLLSQATVREEFVEKKYQVFCIIGRLLILVQVLPLPTLSKFKSRGILVANKP